MSLHDLLFNLHLPIVDDVPSCLHIFYEYQPVVPLMKENLAQMDQYYNIGVEINSYFLQMESSAFQKICFSSDDDGLSSIQRINKEVAKNTFDQIRYAIREENAPNSAKSTDLTAAEFLRAIDSLPKNKAPVSVCIPHFSVMTPIRMSESSNRYDKFGIGRVFDNEKIEDCSPISRAELVEQKRKARDIRHQIAEEERIIRQRSSLVVHPDNCVPVNVFKYNDNDDLFKESHKITNRENLRMTRDCGEGRIVLCMGHFNNVDAIHTNTLDSTFIAGKSQLV
uniref:CUE domain-containing protein n=1 Tax=Heterorhabditis bacteriophora TaxID=37862 RepID=A0A1I7XHY2_HETBA